MRTCPHCGEPIGLEADSCPHCRADLVPHPAGSAEELQREGNPSRLFIAGGIALLGLWAVAWFVIPWHFSGRMEEAEMIARDSVSQVQGALETYKSQHGTYPASLDGLPEPVWVALKKARSAHYEIRYSPGPPDSSRNVATYSLTARGKPAGFASYYTDQTQFFHSTTQSRDATAQDPRLKPDNTP